jgi:hypothetical protein
MHLCHRYVYNGMVLRSVLTIATLYALSGPFFAKHLTLILPIALTLLDTSDNVWTKYYRQNICTHIYTYQVSDKICDAASYLLVLAFFDFDNILWFFVFYRLMGVLLFTITKQTLWLVVCFDFVKEYLIYSYMFGHNLSYLGIGVVGKIVFEYFFHRVYHKKV